MQPTRKPPKKVAAAVTDVVFEGADNSIDADNYVVDTSFDDATAGVSARCRTASPRQHALAYLLRHKERTFDVGVKGEVKIFLGHILNALGGAHPRIVDQDVDRADLGLGVRHRRLD